MIELTQLQVVTVMLLSSRAAKMMGFEPAFNFEAIACIASADPERFKQYMKEPFLIDAVKAFLLTADDQNFDPIPVLTNCEDQFRRQSEVMQSDPEKYKVLVSMALEIGARISGKLGDLQ